MSTSRRVRQRVRSTPLLIVAASALVLAGCSRAPAPAQGVGGIGVSVPITGNGTAAGNAAAPGTAGAKGVAGKSGSTTTANGGGAAISSGDSSNSGASGSAQGSSGSGSTSGGGSTSKSAATNTQLFTPAENRIGISPAQITLCAHAALTYGAAFNTTKDDFNVFWSNLNDHGGIFGRKVEATYENDNYTAADAVTAATACAAKNPFMILGGIGFDQIPAVRNFVEKRHILYLHHTATLRGTAGQKYSFSELPSVERTGAGFAQLAHQLFQGMKIGIIERDSPNWSPGTDSFKSQAKKYGLNIVSDAKVVDKQGNYTNEILQMKNAGAQVVFGWENALNATELIKQAKAQQYSPHWMVFGLNIMSQALGTDALNPPLVGSVMFTPYSFGDYTGSFAPYATDVQEFEAEYHHYRPNADLRGVGGDLLFLNWVGQKALARQFLLCGKDCTRNKFVDVLRGYDATPTSAACKIDFVHSDGFHGAQQVNFVESYLSPSGKVNFRNLQPCVGL